MAIPQPQVNANVPPLDQQVQPQYAGNPLGLSTAATQLIPIFAGDESVRTFLGYVEDVAELEGWTELQKVKVAKLKLQGAARRLVEWNEELKNPNCTWNQLKNALINRFESKVTQVDHLHRFRLCVQRAGESVTEFAERLQMLGAATIKRTADPNQNDWIRTHLREECLMQFIEGLAMPIQQRVMSAAPRTFEDAVEIALREEQIENRLRRKTLQRAIEAEEFKLQGKQEEPVLKEHLQYIKMPKYSRQNGQQTLKCWGCNKTGHMQADCKNCFECGQRGHFRRQCYKLNQPQSGVKRQNWNRPHAGNKSEGWNHSQPRDNRQNWVRSPSGDKRQGWTQRKPNLNFNRAAPAQQGAARN
ncbi:uncharacterized protein LOC123009113 [Tribolium madens]|uniref:uncharacterized protein LOC123009113 n=1 Tax=Tribolium madens TaxID=41895 RepID=UPI001CF72025|nr:uncharacterized protein LOC123009113 [Tribolium madens]